MPYLAPKFAFLILAAAVLPAQTTQTKTREFDANGTPFSTTSSTEVRTATGFSRTELGATLNGSVAPRAKVEERVIREDANGKVIERIIRKFDQDGNPTPPERAMVEERKDSSGAITTRVSVYRADLNGNQQLAERATTVTSKSGDVTTAATQVERVAADGSLRLAEKSHSQAENTDGKSKESTVVYRADANGNFVEAARDVRDASTANGKTVENRAQYVDGVLVQQELATTTTKPDGSKVTSVNIFAQQARSGIAAPADGKLVLKEQQTIESKVTQTGIVETITSRSVSVNEGGRLGEPRKIAETVCTGCKPKEAEPKK